MTEPRAKTWARCPTEGCIVEPRKGYVYCEEHAGSERVHYERAAALTAERDRFREALLQIADVYHDSELTNAQAQDSTYGIVRAALDEASR